MAHLISINTQRKRDLLCLFLNKSCGTLSINTQSVQFRKINSQLLRNLQNSARINLCAWKPYLKPRIKVWLLQCMETQVSSIGPPVRSKLDSRVLQLGNLLQQSQTFLQTNKQRNKLTNTLKNITNCQNDMKVYDTLLINLMITQTDIYILTFQVRKN